MYYHLRFTPYELPSENLTTFCDKYQRYIIAHERYKRDGKTEVEPHYHIWLDSDLDLDSVRTAFKKHLHIPTGGKGRNNKYYSLEQYRKGEDVTYIIKQKDIRGCKGFDTQELIARSPPEPAKEKVEDDNSKINLTSKKKVTNFWNEIVERAILWEKSNSKKIEVEDALKLITKTYFSKGLPLPHPGDRKRWGTSLCMYSKMDWEYVESKHDKIIEDESLAFMAEHMISKEVSS